MAERNTAKSKRTEIAKPPVKTPAKTLAGGGASAENMRLKAELAVALERIADLELKQSEIINRIDWVIDSLHNLPD
jgi:hypothetical protein